MVWRLDRLGRSLKDLIEMVTLLETRMVGLKSLHESLDTSSSSGKLIFHIFAALAEFRVTTLFQGKSPLRKSAKGS